MPKKIYDIKPPKPVRKKSAPKKVENNIKEFLDAEKETPVAAPVVKKRETKRETEKKSFVMPLAVGSAVVLLGIGVFLFFKLPKADIKIWPKIDTLSFQQTIVADKSAVQADAVKNVIPAKYFEVSKSDSQEFPATGSADNAGKASGIIIVFNKYNPPAPFTLKTGTHFVSDSGKLYVSLQKIVIPAAKKVGSKITPGSVQVKIQAVEGGDQYNIAPSNFSVPGLKGTAYYFSINATSSVAMAGGQAGKIKKVTDDDIQSAKDVLTKKLNDSSIAELKTKIPADYILADGASSTETVTASTATKAGTVADKFTYKETVKASAMAFKKSDLEDYAKAYIISKMPDGKTLLDGSLKTDYSATTVDITGGKETLQFNFSSGVYQNIDKNSLALSLLGENENQITSTINNALGENASKTTVKFWPFWVSASPNNQKAVNIYLEFK